MDNTGTLTCGKLTVEHVCFLGGWSTESEATQALWQAVYHLTTRSHHPVSRLLLQYAVEQSTSLDLNKTADAVEVTSFEEYPGLGIAGTLSCRGATTKIAIGNHYFMQFRRMYFAPKSNRATLSLSIHSTVYISTDGQLAASVTYSDPVAPYAKFLIQLLHDRGLETHIMTGDTRTSALAVSQELGIKDANVQGSL